jgi:hypothetical protein
MNITTIIELENHEVENIAGAKLVFAQEQIEENIIETCVDGFKVEGSENLIPTEDAMEKVFNHLKKDGVIPAKVEDFSFEMPSCERMKRKNDEDIEMPQKIILSFMS